MILALYYISEVQISASLIQGNCRSRISSYSQESDASQHGSAFRRRANLEAALQTCCMFNIHCSWEAPGKDKVKCQRVMNAPNRTRRWCGISWNFNMHLQLWEEHLNFCLVVMRRRHVDLVDWQLSFVNGVRLLVVLCIKRVGPLIPTQIEHLSPAVTLFLCVQL